VVGVVDSLLDTPEYSPKSILKNSSKMPRKGIDNSLPVV